MIDDEIADLKTEVQNLQKVDHPNIVKYYDTYEDMRHVYLVMEYCPGGELIDRIIKKGRFTEKEAAGILSKLIKAVIHCHQMNICHRDIKPENIMYGQDDEVKLIDFGLSQDTKGKVMRELAGTPFYMAPEVINGKYGRKCDYWSLGILLYQLISGMYPFYSETQHDLFNQINTCELVFPEKYFKKISPQCIELIKGLICKDAATRLGDECIDHPWFTKFMNRSYDSEEDVIDEQVLVRLTSYKKTSQLKKIALNLLVRFLNPKDLELQRNSFERIDTHCTGFIDIKEFETAMSHSHLKLPVKEIKQLFMDVDYKHNNKINYSEFLAATVDLKELLTSQRLMALFKYFDVNDSGKIKKDDITMILKKLGRSTD